MDRKCLEVLMKLEVDIDSMTSRWMAFILRQLKLTAHLLFSAAPPRVYWVSTFHGPKTSSPT